MTICYDNLERLCFTKNGTWRLKTSYGNGYKTATCDWCGEECLTALHNKGNAFCDRSCLCYHRMQKYKTSPEHKKALYKVNQDKYNKTFNGRAKNLWHAKRKKCKAKGIPFDLTKEWYEERLAVGCELTGLPFKLKNGKGIIPESPTVDRIDPAGGYLMSNCRLVLMGLNALKGAGTDDTMYKLAEALIKHKPKTEVRMEVS